MILCYLLTTEGDFSPLLQGDTNARFPAAYMIKKTKKRNREASAQHEPRLVGEILHDYLENSNEPLAVVYRERHEESEGETDQLFKTVFPNTEVAVNLKLLTRKPGRLPVEASLEGVLTRRSEDDFLFIQNASEKRTAASRNPHLYRGSCINVVRKSDGMLVPTFCCPRYTKNFTFADFCRKAAEELLAVAGLIENV